MSDTHIHPLLATLKQQATPRALTGLAVLLLILSFSGISSLSDVVSGQANRINELNREMAVQSSISNETDWLERAQRAHGLVEDYETSFWRGDTAGIVVAQLQSTLEAMAAAAGLGNVRITVQPTPDALGQEAFVFEISISARDANGQFLSFMQAVSRSDNVIIPTSLDWRRTNGNVNFVLIAPAIINPAEEETSR